MPSNAAEKYERVQIVPAQPGYFLVCKNNLKRLLSEGSKLDDTIKEVMGYAHPVIAWMISKQEGRDYFETCPIKPIGINDSDNIIICPNGIAMQYFEYGETLEKFIKMHITKEIEWR